VIKKDLNGRSEHNHHSITRKIGEKIQEKKHVGVVSVLKSGSIEVIKTFQSGEKATIEKNHSLD